MPRYFFHVDNGEFIPDETGADLPDLQAARREAVRAAGEMIDEAQESFWDHLSLWNMHVTDSDHRLLFTLTFGAKIPSGDARYIPDQAATSASGSLDG
ncbi:hypothetical protein [Mesorhizobium sp. YM1C-6-2]|jgi:hypothetical protein|uniref:DUF6894 family protein n=1 Tax=Mesorhizobium sp. YM1C-6-2 TaxID=1827501 RepID=UPI000EF1F0CC|nr:hypothetical protein [Mesorhizobium sp. YM1C-6-2]RLP26346.1 hypothetical protein D8676_11805 [Mesorhizobium sp. YM1C-6-2]